MPEQQQQRKNCQALRLILNRNRTIRSDLDYARPLVPLRMRPFLPTKQNETERQHEGRRTEPIVMSHAFACGHDKSAPSADATARWPPFFPPIPGERALDATNRQRYLIRACAATAGAAAGTKNKIARMRIHVQLPQSSMTIVGRCVSRAPLEAKHKPGIEKKTALATQGKIETMISRTE